MTVNGATLTAWQQGTPCELHDMPYCGGCRELAGITRKLDGTLGYKGDCGVLAYADLTGAAYDDALTAVTAFRAGHGTPTEGITDALRNAGYTVTTSPLTILAAVTSGRVFLVSGVKGKNAHAWAISGGHAPRAYRPPYRYQIFEVSK